MDDAVEPTPYPVNPAGFVIHSAIHGAREDAHCVLHTHTKAGCAIAAQKDGLLPINQINLEFYNNVAYHDYEGIALDLDEQKRLVADLGDQAGDDPAQPRPPHRRQGRAAGLPAHVLSGEGLRDPVRPRRPAASRWSFRRKKSASIPSASSTRPPRRPSRRPHPERSRRLRSRLERAAAPPRSHRPELQELNAPRSARRCSCCSPPSRTPARRRISPGPMMPSGKNPGEPGPPMAGGHRSFPYGAAHAMLWKLDNGPGLSRRPCAPAGQRGRRRLRIGKVVPSAWWSTRVTGGMLGRRMDHHRQRRRPELGRETLEGPADSRRHLQDHARPEPRRHHQLHRRSDHQALGRHLSVRLDGAEARLCRPRRADRRCAGGGLRPRPGSEASWPGVVAIQDRRCRQHGSASGPTAGSSKTGTETLQRRARSRPASDRRRIQTIRFWGLPGEEVEDVVEPAAHQAFERRGAVEADMRRQHHVRQVDFSGRSGKGSVGKTSSPAP